MSKRKASLPGAREECHRLRLAHKALFAEQRGRIFKIIDASFHHNRIAGRFGANTKPLRSGGGQFLAPTTLKCLSCEHEIGALKVQIAVSSASNPY